MSIVVDRRLTQRHEALERANDVRMFGARWKEWMESLPRLEARREAVRVLTEEPELVGGLSIHAVLVAIPYLGDVQAQRILTNRREGWYVWPFRKVRELTAHQRRMIADRLLEPGR